MESESDESFVWSRASSEGSDADAEALLKKAVKAEKESKGKKSIKTEKLAKDEIAIKTELLERAQSPPRRGKAPHGGRVKRERAAYTSNTSDDECKPIIDKFSADEAEVETRPTRRDTDRRHDSDTSTKPTNKSPKISPTKPTNKSPKVAPIKPYTSKEYISDSSSAASDAGDSLRRARGRDSGDSPHRARGRDSGDIPHRARGRDSGDPDSSEAGDTPEHIARSEASESPPRAVRVCSEVSPPRAARGRSEVSPPRAARGRSEVSTPRAARVCSEVSPPRAARGRSEVSPPRAARGRSEVSPPRAARGRSEVSPRRTRGIHNGHSDRHSASDSSTRLTSPKPRRNTISERIQFEEDDASANEFQPERASRLSARMQRYLRANPLLKEVAIEAGSEAVWAGPIDQLWLLRVPTELDVSALRGTTLTLDDKCKLKVDGQVYEGRHEGRGTLALLTARSSGSVIQRVPLVDAVSFRRKNPRPRLMEDDAQDESEAIPMPDTKRRHPLFGVDYKKAIKLPSAIRKKLKAKTSIELAPAPEQAMEVDALTGPDDREQRKKRKRKKERDSECSVMADPTPEAGTAKRRRRKHRDTEWDSEKAIEESLFNF